MKRKNRISNSNYLDYIPKQNDNYRYETDDTGMIIIHQKNQGIFNKLAQIFLKKPKVSYIHLDEMGSFIWKHIDGNRSIYDIAEIVKEEFGDRAEPLYNRLVQYMKTMESYNFISVGEDSHFYK